MQYLNKRFYEYMNTSKENLEILEEMKRDVTDFMSSFSDVPERMSIWGHYYFCDEDGGRLIFDRKSPDKHRCAVCGKVYTGEILKGTWSTFYRNSAVVSALVSAVVYKATEERTYFDYAFRIVDFYAQNYDKFILHAKEDQPYTSYDNMAWGCGRIMPQGLNEAIIAIRFAQTIEILKEELDAEWLAMVYKKMFREMFFLLAPQVTSIHNISCWALSAIGVMGFVSGDQEMIDFAFKSRLNIRVQLEKGVTEDYFWREGSIYYHFFLLEGVSYLLLFSRIYHYNFGEESSRIIEEMLVRAYHYAFDNQYLPNPNDGWPDLNLQTFSYVYHTVARALGEYSSVGNLVKLIEASTEPRTAFPLSEPYYVQNRICLERLLFNIDFSYENYFPVERVSQNFPKSNFAILRNQTWNVFLKYGLNGKTHAHPDIMNVEIMCKNHRISRDLSNAGYRSKLCREWHKKTISHNTVCRNGTDITSVAPGECISFENNRIEVRALNVYESIDYGRVLEIAEDSFLDTFQVKGSEGIYDYFLHLESDISLQCNEEMESSDPGFDTNGYQHILETQKVKVWESGVVLTATVMDFMLKIEIQLEKNQELYLLKTKDNPVNKVRNTILLRSKGADPCYRLSMQIGEKESSVSRRRSFRI